MFCFGRLDRRIGTVNQLRKLKAWAHDETPHMVKQLQKYPIVETHNGTMRV